MPLSRKTLVTRLAVALLILAEIAWLVVQHRRSMLDDPYRRAELMRAAENYDASSPETVSALDYEIDQHRRYRDTRNIEMAAIFLVLDAGLIYFFWNTGTARIEGARIEY